MNPGEVPVRIEDICLGPQGGEPFRLVDMRPDIHPRTLFLNSHIEPIEDET